MSNNDTYAKLVIDFQAKIDNMERNTARAASSLDKFAVSAKSIGNMLTGGIFAAGIAGAVKGLASLAMGAIEMGDKIAKQSQRLSMSAKEYQTLSLAAQLCGQDIEMVSKMIDLSNKKIADATRGGESAEIFGRIGLDANELANMNTIDRIKTISEAINGLGNAVLRSEAHMKIFGKSGAQAAIFTRDFTSAMERAQKTVGEGLSQKAQVDLQELQDRYTETTVKVNQLKMAVVAAAGDYVMSGDAMADSLTKIAFPFDTGTIRTLMWLHGQIFGSAAGTPKSFSELGTVLGDLEKKYQDSKLLDFTSGEDLEKILASLETPMQKYNKQLATANDLKAQGLLVGPQYNAHVANLNAELEKSDPALSQAAAMADKYTDSLMALDRQLDAVIVTSSRVPGKVDNGVVAEAGAAMGKEAWTTIQGEQLYKSMDAARQYRMEMDALSKALETGRISQALFDQAAAYGEGQYNDARSAGMFSAIEGALNALEQNRINSTTEALQEMAQVRMDSLAAELQSVADAFSELQSFAQGEYFATRNPFEKYAAHMEKLDMADMFGMIDPDTYMRSAMMAAYEMDRALGLDKLPQMGSPFIAPPAAPGTAGFSTASQIAGVLAGAMAPANIAKQQLTEAQKTNMLLERSMYSDRGIYL